MWVPVSPCAEDMSDEDRVKHVLDRAELLGISRLLDTSDLVSRALVGLSGWSVISFSDDLPGMSGSALQQQTEDIDNKVVMTYVSQFKRLDDNQIAEAVAAVEAEEARRAAEEEERNRREEEERKRQEEEEERKQSEERRRQEEEEERMRKEEEERHRLEEEERKKKEDEERLRKEEEEHQRRKEEEERKRQEEERLRREEEERKRKEEEERKRLEEEEERKRKEEEERLQKEEERKRLEEEEERRRKEEEERLQKEGERMRQAEEQRRRREEEERKRQEEEERKRLEAEERHRQEEEERRRKAEEERRRQEAAAAERYRRAAARDDALQSAKAFGQGWDACRVANRSADQLDDAAPESNVSESKSSSANEFHIHLKRPAAAAASAGDDEPTGDVGGSAAPITDQPFSVRVSLVKRGSTEVIREIPVKIETASRDSVEDGVDAFQITYPALTFGELDELCGEEKKEKGIDSVQEFEALIRVTFQGSKGTSPIDGSPRRIPLERWGAEAAHCKVRTPLHGPSVQPPPPKSARAHQRRPAPRTVKSGMDVVGTHRPGTVIPVRVQAGNRIGPLDHGGECFRLSVIGPMDTQDTPVGEKERQRTVVELEDLDNGEYPGSAGLPETPGWYEVRLGMLHGQEKKKDDPSGEQLSGYPTRVLVSDVCPEQSFLSGQGVGCLPGSRKKSLTGVRSGAMTSFTIHGVGPDGRPLQTSWDRDAEKTKEEETKNGLEAEEKKTLPAHLRVRVSQVSGVEDEKQSELPLEVTDNQDGTYTVFYTPESGGEGDELEIDCTWYGKALSNAPVRVKVVSPPQTSKPPKPKMEESESDPPVEEQRSQQQQKQPPPPPPQTHGSSTTRGRSSSITQVVSLERSRVFGPGWDGIPAAQAQYEQQKKKTVAAAAVVGNPITPPSRKRGSATTGKQERPKIWSQRPVDFTVEFRDTRNRPMLGQEVDDVKVSVVFRPSPRGAVGTPVSRGSPPNRSSPGSPPVRRRTASPIRGKSSHLPQEPISPKRSSTPIARGFSARASPSSRRMTPKSSPASSRATAGGKAGGAGQASPAKPVRVPHTLVKAEDGSFRVEYTGKWNGVYRLGVSVDGKHLPGSPTLVEACEYLGEPESKFCSVYGPGVGIPAPPGEEEDDKDGVVKNDDPVDDEGQKELKGSTTFTIQVCHPLLLRSFDMPFFCSSFPLSTG